MNFTFEDEFFYAHVECLCSSRAKRGRVAGHPCDNVASVTWHAAELGGGSARPLPAVSLIKPLLFAASAAGHAALLLHFAQIFSDFSLFLLRHNAFRLGVGSD